MSILLNKTIRLFLDSIGRREEYEYYLERFSAVRPRAFALLVPEHDGFEDSAGVFAFDMGFLLRLGLDPVVLLCGETADVMAGFLLAEDHPFDVHPVAAVGPDALAEIMERLEAARQGGRSLLLLAPGLSMNAVLEALVPAVTRRIHFIRARGPLHTDDGRPLLFYQTQRPVPLAEEDRLLAERCGRLMGLADGLHISVTSPLRLLEELFTVKGAGCLIRRGAVIHHMTRLDDLDTDRLVALIEEGFGRRLCRRDFLSSASDVFVEDQYRGAALLEPAGDSMYLSKFTVRTEARGEGLAQDIWSAVVERYPALFWRSSPRNPINQWYDRQADGHHRDGDWIIYWRGIPVDRIPDRIRDALGRPADFESGDAAGSGPAMPGNGY